MSQRKIFSNAWAQILWKISTALISIFLIQILTRYLDIAGFGLYSKIYNYLSIFAVLADLWLYTIAVREMAQVAEKPWQAEKIAGVVLSLRSLLWASILILAPSIAYFLPGYNSPQAMWGIVIISIFTFFWLITSSQMSLLQAILKTEYSFISTTSWKLLTLVLTYSIATFFLPNTNPESQFYWLLFIFLAGLAGNILMYVLLQRYTQSVRPFSYVWDKWLALQLLRESLPFWWALFLSVIYFKIDVVLLSFLEPREIADYHIGIYSLPMKLVEVGMLFWTVYLNSLLPILSQNKTQPEVFQKYFYQARSLLFLFWCSIVGFLAIRSDWVVEFIWGSSFTQINWPIQASTLLFIVSWIFLFYFLSSLNSFALMALWFQKKLLWLHASITLLNTIWNLIFIPQYSVLWSALVTVFCQVILLIGTSFFLPFQVPRKTFLIQILLFLNGIIAGYIAYILSPHLESLPNIIRLLLVSGVFLIFFFPTFVYTFWVYKKWIVWNEFGKIKP